MPMPATITPLPADARASLRQSLGHEHGLATIAGYVVRVTCEPGADFHPREQDRDLVAYGSPRMYGEALEAAHAIRDARGWAVVDVVYACGCRS